MELGVESCNDKCDQPCNEYIYDTMVSASGMWPSVGYQMFYYELAIRDVPSKAEQFAAYEKIYADVISGKLTKVGRDFIAL